MRKRRFIRFKININVHLLIDAKSIVSSRYGIDCIATKRILLYIHILCEFYITVALIGRFQILFIDISNKFDYLCILYSNKQMLLVG